MSAMKTQNRRSESGNALFLILIAVALFAALSYAVTQSGRGSGSIDKEQGQISAAQITQFPAAVRTAVTRMVITGTSAGLVDLDTTPTSGDSNAVFDPAGGGVVVQTPPTAGVVSTAYHFVSSPVTAVGGNFIKGVGSDAGSADGLGTGRDAFSYLVVSKATCTAINRGLGLGGTIENENTTAWVAPTSAEGEPDQQGGSTAFTSVGADNAWTLDAYTSNPQAFACIENDTSTSDGPYYYYHALIEQ